MRLLELTLVLACCCCYLTAVAAATDGKSCSEDFGQLEENLLSKSENRFELTRAFFPARIVQPVFVTVNYVFNSTPSTLNATWYWSEAEFYFIQPLEVFQFSSLFFSNRPHRQGTVTLQLDGECQNASDEFMQILTERLELYAQTATVSPQSAPARISRAYVAVATSREEVVTGKFQSHFVEIWLHFVILLTPILLALLIYMCDPIQSLFGNKTWQKLEDESSHPSIASFIMISIFFTIYVFIVDLIGIAYSVESELLSYKRDSIFYISVVTTLLIDGFAFLLVMIVLVISCLEEAKGLITKVVSHKLRPGYSFQVYKILLVTMLAPVLCLANHIHFILIAFASDPFHAGSIWIAYIISLGFYFFMFRQFYARFSPAILGRDAKITPSKAEHRAADTSWKKDYYRTRFSTHTVIVGLFTIAPLIAVFQALVIVLYINLPVSKTWEDAPSTLYSIYQGTGILIVMLLTYNILLNPSPFSLVKAVNKIGHEINIIEKLPNWDKFSNEEKFANIVLELHSKSYQEKPAKAVGEPVALEEPVEEPEELNTVNVVTDHGHADSKL